MFRNVYKNTFCHRVIFFFETKPNVVSMKEMFCRLLVTGRRLAVAAETSSSSRAVLTSQARRQAHSRGAIRMWSVLDKKLNTKMQPCLQVGNHPQTKVSKAKLNSACQRFDKRSWSSMIMPFSLTRKQHLSCRIMELLTWFLQTGVRVYLEFLFLFQNSNLLIGQVLPDPTIYQVNNHCASRVTLSFTYATTYLIGQFCL